MQVEWRRPKVLELLSMDNSQTEIAKTLQIDLSIVSRDTSFLRQQAKNNIRKYIDERLPVEYEKCLVGLNAIVKEVWNTSQQTEDRREKIQALSLAKECYAMKLDLLTNATVVDDAIRFVTEHGKSITTVSLEGSPAAIKPKIHSGVNSQWSKAAEDIRQQSLNITTNEVF